MGGTVGVFMKERARQDATGEASKAGDWLGGAPGDWETDWQVREEEVTLPLTAQCQVQVGQGAKCPLLPDQLYKQMPAKPHVASSPFPSRAWDSSSQSGMLGRHHN